MKENRLFYWERGGGEVWFEDRSSSEGTAKERWSLGARFRLRIPEGLFHEVPSTHHLSTPPLHQGTGEDRNRGFNHCAGAAVYQSATNPCFVDSDATM